MMHYLRRARNLRTKWNMVKAAYLLGFAIFGLACQGTMFADEIGRQPVEFSRSTQTSLECPSEMLPLGAPQSVSCVDPDVMIRIKSNHEQFESKIRSIARGQIEVDFQTTYLSQSEHRLSNTPFNLPVLRVVFQTDRFFETDQSVILPEAIPAWRTVADALMEAPDGSALFVVGHTDADGGVDYNHALGLGRAEEVAKAIITRGAYGAEIYRLSFGELMPLESNASNAGRARNRRVEFLFAIRPKAADSQVDQDIKQACSSSSHAAKCEATLRRDKQRVIFRASDHKDADRINDEENRILNDSQLSEEERRKRLRANEALRGRLPVVISPRRKSVTIHRRIPIVE